MIKSALGVLHEKATRRMVGDFLRHLIKPMPDKSHTVLTDDGTHFNTPGNVASAASMIKEKIAAGETFRARGCGLACTCNDIDHRPTKPGLPWTNGRVARMNLHDQVPAHAKGGDATVKRCRHNNHGLLCAELADSVSVDNFARRLKTLRGLSPGDAICKA